MKKPTQEDFAAYDGGHCFNMWARLPDGWACPGCGRSQFEILRWAVRKWKPYVGKCPAYWGWFAGLHEHHDHSMVARFDRTVICDQCNAADGAAKKVLGLPKDFSFTPEEIGQFIRATPHGKHEIDLAKAREVYKRCRP